MIRFSSSEIPLSKIWKTDKPKFVKVAQNIMSQEIAMAKWMPEIQAKGNHYYKFAQVRARKANPNEKIETWTSDSNVKPETVNEAKEDGYVVTNIDSVGESYITPTATFEKRYYMLEDDGDPRGAIYQAKGEGMAIEYNGDLGNEIEFMASWGSPQTLVKGDMIMSPLPDLNEVYRVEKDAFIKTYKLKENR